MIRFFEISGDSLYPLRKDGEKILCIKVFNFIPVRIGDIVVFQKEEYPKMIKRVRHIDNNRYFVQGTIPQSIDSRNFGYLKKEEILYKQLFKRA